MDSTASDMLQQKVAQDCSSFMSVLMLQMGDKLGLFKALAAAGRPLTAGELAQATQTNERYVLEWLLGMFTAGYVERDALQNTFYLTEAQAAVLTTEGGAKYTLPMVDLIVNLSNVFDQVVRHFKNGGGVSLHSYPNETWVAMERMTGLKFEHQLLSWLDLLDERVKQKLSDKNSRIADIGCGRGRALIKLAHNFPNCSFFGFDVVEENVKNATLNIKDAGITNVEIALIDANATIVPNVKSESDKYDVIFVFDVIHDSANPLQLLTTIRKSLKDDGIFICLDINASSNPKENAPVLYGLSLLFCMTTSLGDNGAGLGTAGLTADVIKKLSLEAGFSSVRKVPIVPPLNTIYEIRP